MKFAREVRQAANISLLPGSVFCIVVRFRCK